MIINFSQTEIAKIILDYLQNSGHAKPTDNIVAVFDVDFANVPEERIVLKCTITPPSSVTKKS